MQGAVDAPEFIKAATASARSMNEKRGILIGQMQSLRRDVDDLRIVVETCDRRLKKHFPLIKVGKRALRSKDGGAMATAKERAQSAQKKEAKMIKPGKKKAFAANERKEHAALEEVGRERRRR